MHGCTKSIKGALFSQSLWRIISPFYTFSPAKDLRYTDQHYNFTMLLLQIVAVVVALTTATEAAAIIDISPAPVTSRDLVENTSPVAPRDLLQVTTPLVVTNVTRYTKPNTELAVIDKRANEGIILGVLVQSAAVVGAVCTAAAFSALLGVAACIAAGAYAAIAGIWALVLATTRSKRAFEDSMLNIHADYIPNQGCNVGCRLAASSPHGEWTHFANITSSG